MLNIELTKQGNQNNAITGSKENPKNRYIYRSGVLKRICKQRGVGLQEHPQAQWLGRSSEALLMVMD